MVFEPLVEGVRSLRGLLPDRFGWPHLNFIKTHYLYMVGMTILGSIILYPPQPRLLSYTDALFFAAGSATQSGLNTTNVNDLYLYQQVVFMLIACVCNPIFINTMVVFLRLYWFEKRFEHVVKESQEMRRSRARTLTWRKSEMKDEQDLSRAEKGVGGRQIKVLHHTTKPNGMSGPTTRSAREEKEFAEKLGLDHHERSVSTTPPDGSNKSSDHSDDIMPDEKREHEQDTRPETPQTSYLGLNPRLNREIMFADEVQSPGAGHAQTPPPLEVVPEQSEADKHILFLQKQQQNAHKEGGTLRIPGPRDFDLGAMPKELEDSDNELHRPLTKDTLRLVRSERDRAATMGTADKGEELNDDDHPRRGIAFDEPDHPGHHSRDGGDEDHGSTTAFKQTLSKAKSVLSHRRNHSRGPKLSDSRARTFNSTFSGRSKEKITESMPYLSWQATIGRNSAFLGLTQVQREELGGIEYRALKTLAAILIAYFVGFHLLGMIILLPWILNTNPWNSIVRSDGVNPVWWGFFTPASMFNDLGFTLTPDSMNSFQTATLPMLLGSFLIVIGNTGFPCMLRFVIWVLSKLVPAGEPDDEGHRNPLWEELQFLLDHPRRCFTLLFPSRATWWLFWVLILLNGLDLVFFIILDLHDPTVTSLAPGYRVLNGLFQATSTRTAGFSCVNLADLHPAIQVSYLIMMYISVFPIAISVRRTNVYEEKSLGLFGGEETQDGDDAEQSYVGQHLRRQLSFDLWYVFLGFFIICIVEGDRLSNTNEYAFTMFSVLFEIVSAYGTVGLSLGYPGIDASFSAEFHVISKLVIVAMMIRGRHRGLPYALDRAILLPSENMHKKDDEATLPRRSSATERERTWEDGDLDENGLPMQHTGAIAQAMAAGAGGETSQERRRTRRRGSAVTIDGAAEGGDRKQKRSRSLSMVLGQTLQSGLSAGPTLSKRD